jgi:hypothetical protein
MEKNKLEKNSLQTKKTKKNHNKEKKKNVYFFLKKLIIKKKNVKLLCPKIQFTIHYNGIITTLSPSH